MHAEFTYFINLIKRKKIKNFPFLFFQKLSVTAMICKQNASKFKIVGTWPASKSWKRIRVNLRSDIRVSSWPRFKLFSDEILNKFKDDIKVVKGMDSVLVNTWLYEGSRAMSFYRDPYPTFPFIRAGHASYFCHRLRLFLAISPGGGCAPS